MATLTNPIDAVNNKTQTRRKGDGKRKRFMSRGDSDGLRVRGAKLREKRHKGEG